MEIQRFARNFRKVALSVVLLSFSITGSTAPSEKDDRVAILQPLVTSHATCLFDAIMSAGAADETFKPTMSSIKDFCPESREDLVAVSTTGKVKKFEQLYLDQFELYQQGKLKPLKRPKDKILDLE